MSNWSQDGGLCYLTEAEGNEAIETLRLKYRFNYGKGEVGVGLYSPTWDRQMGEWDEIRGANGYIKVFAVNPSIIWHYLPHLHPKDEVRLPIERHKRCPICSSTRCTNPNCGSRY